MVFLLHGGGGAVGADEAGSGALEEAATIGIPLAPSNTDGSGVQCGFSPHG